MQRESNGGCYRSALAGLRVFRKEGHHGVRRSLGLFPDIRIEIVHGGKRVLDALNVIGWVNGMPPCMLNIRVGWVDLVSGLQFGTLRGIHRVNAKDAATDQVCARIARVRCSRGIEGLRGEPWLSLAQLHFSQSGESARRAWLIGGGLVRPGPSVGDPAFMQQGMNEGDAQIQIVWLFEKCLQVKTLGALVFRLLVGDLGRRGLVRRQRGTGGALGESGTGGKKKGRREQRKWLNRSGLGCISLFRKLPSDEP